MRDDININMSNPLERFKDTLMKKDTRHGSKDSAKETPKMHLGARLKAEKEAKAAKVKPEGTKGGKGVQSNLKKK